MAGKEGYPTTFLMNDNQIIQEDFLESLNNILNTGEIAKLFDEESVWDDIFEHLRAAAK